MSNYLKVANCRGKKPVLNDIKRAYMILSGISFEINTCPAQSRLRKAQDELFEIIEQEGYYIDNRNKLQKHKT